MAGQAQHLMTVEEFLAWDDGTDTRHELIDGVITAMAPPSNADGTVAGNVLVRIREGLRGRPDCRAQIEAGVRVSERTWWQADIAVSCTPITPGSEIDRPVLVIEILSPRTRTNDLGRKLDDYKTLPDTEEIWMVDSGRRWVQIWWRNEDGAWTGRDHVGDGSFESRALGQPIELDELYATGGL